MADRILPQEVITRQQAKQLKLVRYSPGSTCANGHIAERYTRNGECVSCAKERYYHDPAAFGARSKNWKQRNRERVAETARLWRTRNPERDKVNNHRYRSAHRELVNARTKQWRQNNQGHCRTYSKTYEHTKRDKKKVYARVLRWIRQNPQKKAAMSGRRRARKMGASGSYTVEDIQRLLRKQNGSCVGISPWCMHDITTKYTIDHKTPLSRGGSNNPCNLQLLCRPCNASKGTKTMKEWIAAMRHLSFN